jgi:hypothetical protein
MTEYERKTYGMSRWFDEQGRPLSPEKHAEADAVARRLLDAAMAVSPSPPAPQRRSKPDPA